MKTLNETISFYLKNDTNYALMITGEWGIGKTFYYKNVLTPLIENTPTFNNGSRKYKSIIISLFGIKSIEDLQVGLATFVWTLS